MTLLLSTRDDKYSFDEKDIEMARELGLIDNHDFFCNNEFISDQYKFINENDPENDPENNSQSNLKFIKIRVHKLYGHYGIANIEGSEPNIYIPKSFLRFIYEGEIIRADLIYKKTEKNLWRVSFVYMNKPPIIECILEKNELNVYYIKIPRQDINSLIGKNNINIKKAIKNIKPNMKKGSFEINLKSSPNNTSITIHSGKDWDINEILNVIQQLYVD